MDKIMQRLKNFKYKSTFYTGLLCGLLTHLYMIVNRFPNSDACTNFYFDQNMVTSGRWFLTVVCSLSSYYDLNFVNGILSILYLSIAAVIICMIFDVQSRSVKILIPAVLMTFPATASTFTYLYTADGYMLAFLMAAAAVYVTKRYKKLGFLWGGLLLSLSMGCYQAYLAATVLLCAFDVILMICNGKDIRKITGSSVRYIAMGIEGGVLYFIILKICLFMQKKELDTYQGINTMTQFSIVDIPKRIIDIYRDFAVFVSKGNILVHDGFSCVLVILLLLIATFAFIFILVKMKALKKWYNAVFLVFIIALMPLFTNIIMIVSSKVDNHLLMRFHWSLYFVFVLVLLERALRGYKTKALSAVYAAGLILTAVMCYKYFIMDNVGYFNLQERYEKTYAFAVRLLDRIEQTDGYYNGIPIAMVGVIGDKQYPSTDVTAEVTSHMIGARGDFLLYKTEQYDEYFKNFLGVDLNFLDIDTVSNIYYTKEYQSLKPFPSSDSIRIVDGVMYIKLENTEILEINE